MCIQTSPWPRELLIELLQVLPHDIHPAPEIGSPALNSMDLAGTALQLQPPTARAASPPLSAEQQEEDAVPSSNEGM